jgi:CheY-like chemotaxis protein
MPEMEGAEATHRIRTELPDTQVLVLTTYADDESLFPPCKPELTATSPRTQAPRRSNALCLPAALRALAQDTVSAPDSRVRPRCSRQPPMLGDAFDRGRGVAQVRPISLRVRLDRRSRANSQRRKLRRRRTAEDQFASQPATGDGRRLTASSDTAQALPTFSGQQTRLDTQLLELPGALAVESRVARSRGGDLSKWAAVCACSVGP